MFYLLDQGWTIRGLWWSVLNIFAAYEIYHSFLEFYIFYNVRKIIVNTIIGIHRFNFLLQKCRSDMGIYNFQRGTKDHLSTPVLDCIHICCNHRI